MSESTGPVLLAGSITLGNLWLLNGKPFDARIPIATGIAAGLLALLERPAPTVAVALAWGLVVTSLFVPATAGVPDPATSLFRWFSSYKTPQPFLPKIAKGVQK